MIDAPSSPISTAASKTTEVQAAAKAEAEKSLEKARDNYLEILVNETETTASPAKPTKSPYAVEKEYIEALLKFIIIFDEELKNDNDINYIRTLPNTDPWKEAYSEVDLYKYKLSFRFYEILNDKKITPSPVSIKFLPEFNINKHITILNEKIDKNDNTLNAEILKLIDSKTVGKELSLSD